MRSHAIAERRNQPAATGGTNKASPQLIGVNQVCRNSCVICERERFPRRRRRPPNGPRPEGVAAPATPSDDFNPGNE